MKAVQYTGEIWNGDSVHPDLWNLLLQTDLLIEIFSKPPVRNVESPILLGVPHQGAPHSSQIAEDWLNPKTGQLGRPADENTGLVGLALFSALQERNYPCRLVIAAHATDHDPNKTQGCPYWECLFSDPLDAALPGLLLELHGAAERRHHALELSAGSNLRTDPMLYGRVLAYQLRQEEWLLGVQHQPAYRQAQIYKAGKQTSGRLQNPGLETLTLAHAGDLGIPALHLEMKSLFRAPAVYRHQIHLSEATLRLVSALADSLVMIHRDPPVRISGADLGLPTTAFLTRPSLDYADSFWSAVQEADLIDLANSPDLRLFAPEDLPQYIQNNARIFYGGLPDDPPEETLWLIDQGEFIGRIFFFHWLNDYHRENDGQVDYWIRPSKRRKGYGRLILRLVLERFRQLGLKRILISCLASNTYSRRIIETSRGVFDGEQPEWITDSRRRYWIEL